MIGRPTIDRWRHVTAFTVDDVEAVPKERARTVRPKRGPDGKPIGKAHTFTPERTVEFEQRIGWAARSALRARKISGDVAATILVRTRKPRTARGDIDNIVKSILDGMNGIAYPDDRQVVSLRVHLVDSAPQAQIAVQLQEAVGDAASRYPGPTPHLAAITGNLAHVHELAAHVANMADHHGDTTLADAIRVALTERNTA